jgi:hypothetical protein
MRQTEQLTIQKLPFSDVGLMPDFLLTHHPEGINACPLLSWEGSNEPTEPHFAAPVVDDRWKAGRVWRSHRNCPVFLRPARAGASDALAPGMIGGPTGFAGAERYQYGLDAPEGRVIEAAKALKGAGKAPRRSSWVCRTVLSGS